MSAANGFDGSGSNGDRPIGNPYLIQKVIWLDLPEGRKRTSIRMEEEFWKGLDRLAQMQGRSRDEICTDAVCALPEGKQTSAIRVYILKSLTDLE